MIEYCLTEVHNQCPIVPRPNPILMLATGVVIGLWIASMVWLAHREYANGLIEDTP